MTSNIYDVLRKDLIRGAYMPGQKLATADLKKRYDIGLSPLREALNRLAAVGLLDQTHQKGFKVPELTQEQLDDVASLRRQLEGEAIEQSIAHGDNEWETELVAALHRLHQHQSVFGTADHEQWEMVHARFHRALVNGCGSPWRLRFLEQLYDQFDRYRRIAPSPTHQRENLDEQHNQLAALALARDAQSARTLLEKHIDLSYDVAWHILSEQSTSQPDE